MEFLIYKEAFLYYHFYCCFSSYVYFRQNVNILNKGGKF